MAKKALVCLLITFFYDYIMCNVYLKYSVFVSRNTVLFLIVWNPQ